MRTNLFQENINLSHPQQTAAKGCAARNGPYQLMKRMHHPSLIPTVKL